MPTLHRETFYNYGRFDICIRNDDYPASLEKRKIYVQLPDAEAKSHNYIRVIDESGEDYLYPAAYFRLIEHMMKSSEQLLPQLS
uniref:Uncharacterized protein n=1 Tax=Desulfobacca acetoxidans TaxID=60893 RepID=A0A7V4G8C2_9BACT